MTSQRPVKRPVQQTIILKIYQLQFAHVGKQLFVENTVWGNDQFSETTIFQFDLTPTLHTLFHPIGGSPPIREKAL